MTKQNIDPEVIQAREQLKTDLIGKRIADVEYVVDQQVGDHSARSVEG